MQSLKWRACMQMEPLTNDQLPIIPDVHEQCICRKGTLGLIQKLTKPFIYLSVMTCDFNLFLANLILLAHPPNKVIAAGETRSACHVLNAVANHGILPHDGKNITFWASNTTVRQTFNFAPSLCFFVLKFSADFLGRSYWVDKFDLEELSKYNAIEHDASLTRRNAALIPDQGRPDLALVQELLSVATGKGKGGKVLLTKENLSKQLAKRRGEARAETPEYSESLFHNMFGSADSSMSLTIFGSRVDDLRPMLTEERFSGN
ncbi:Cloroperoxidase [Macroventuria anomochaeta]|uniref:Cloroperoxidase n=1 Tax=Macroventuria anomochaeta TaxID=301207 RepID=A0ACB6RR97_9PLEO|nr:Cloroperoxidase [Macroventuria anomochaeta]KAF2623439.1 Cloroperoxidase [Macroventuria anomochaeta]